MGEEEGGLIARSLKVEVIGDASRYSRSLHEAEGSTSRFGAGVKKLGVAVAATGVVVAAAAVEVGKKTVEAAIAAQEANDKLTQSFKNQGIQMDALSPAVRNLESASRDLGFTNADTRESLTKLINSGKSYKQSVSELAVAQNLARVSGQSLGDATAGLIKLQAGATRAAKTYGIVLAPVTAAQDALKASKVDLTTAAGKEALAHAKVQDKLATGQAYYDALTGKVKGQAQVFSDSAAGGIAKFHAALSNIEETLGAKLLPAFSVAIQGVDNFLNFLTGAGSASDKFKTALETMGVSTEQAGVITAKLGETFSSTFATIKSVVEGTLSGLASFWATWGDTIKQVVSVAFDYIIGTIRNVFQVIQGIFQVFHGLLTGDWTELWNGLKNIFGGFAAQIMTTIRAWASGVEIVFSTLWHAIAAATTSIWNGIVSAISGALNAAKNIAVAGGHAVMDGLLNGLRIGWNTITGWLTEIPGFMQSFFGGALGWLVDAGRAVLQGFLNGLLEVWHTIQNLIGSIGGWIAGHKGPLSYDLRLLEPAGRAIMTGLHRGMTAGMQDVMALTSSIAPTIGGTPGSGSPAVSGGNTTVQLVLDGRVLGEWMYQDMIRRGNRNVSLGFT